MEYLVDEYPTPMNIAVAAPSVPTLDRWADRLTDRGVDVARLGLSASDRLRRWVSVVRETRPDIVHLNLPHTYSAAFGAAARIAKWAGAPAVVATEHLTMIAPMRLRGWLKVAMSRACDRIITLSESNRRDLVGPHRIDPSRVRVVMNGVPDPMPIAPDRVAAARTRLGGRDGVPLLVHVGALTERKGHRVLIDALDRLRDDAWGLACVGEGEDLAVLRAEVESRGLAERIRFVGRDDDVPAVLAASDIVVLPSRLEGVPLVLLEALAVGRPAVTTNVYGVPEIYAGAPDAAALVDAGDPGALAEALREVLIDPERRRAAGEAARRLYDARFTAGHMARATLDVYDEVWS